MAEKHEIEMESLLLQRDRYYKINSEQSSKLYLLPKGCNFVLKCLLSYFMYAYKKNIYIYI